MSKALPKALGDDIEDALLAGCAGDRGQGIALEQVGDTKEKTEADIGP